MGSDGKKDRMIKRAQDITKAAGLASVFAKLVLGGWVGSWVTGNY